MNTKKWYESKTIWLAVVQGLAGVLTAIFAADPGFQLTGVGAFLKSIYDIYLRYKASAVIV